MTIREALGQIASLPYIGNKAGSIRSAKDFENKVTSILRNVAEVEERPNGANGYPTFRCQGIDYVIKTSKGNKPMWNEVYIREDCVLIVNLKFGTAIVHGSFITNKDMVNRLINAKDDAAKILKKSFVSKADDNFFVSGGRVQFGDNIKWEDSKVSFLNKTISLLEKKLSK